MQAAFAVGGVMAAGVGGVGATPVCPVQLGSSGRPLGAGVRAVLFDFVGTLTRAYQRGPGHTWLARLIKSDPRDYLELLDRSYPQRVRGEYGDLVSSVRWLASQLGTTLSPRQLTHAVQARVDSTRADIRLRTEAVPTLSRLRESGVAIGLISDCTHEIPMIIAEMPIADLIHASVYSVDIGAAKPEPIMFTTAANILGVPPTDCLYVGDGGGRELSGARAVGMRAVRLAAPDLDHHLRFDPDPDSGVPSIDSLGDIPGLLGEGPY
jgi:putative hydrolase of the HAD superfamily